MRVLILLLAAAVLTFATGDIPDGDGKALVKERCTGCHGVSKATSANLAEDGWGNIVANMAQMGATLSNAEFNTVVKYLAKNFGPEEPGEKK